jgi:formylglycine-generating enzyme required for sulfatase activity
MAGQDARPVILLAFANSAANPLPSLAEEYRRLDKTLRAAQERGYCELVTAPFATVDDILDAFQNERIRGRIAVLHYAGHADDYQMLLEGAGGKGVVADAGGLAAFLGQQKGLQLVFLNACSTRAQVQGLLTAGVSVVVATDQAIDDGVASEFAGRFYESLANGDSIRVAFDKAAGAVRFARGSETRGLFLVGARDKPEAAHWPWALYERPEAPDAAGWDLFAAAVRERLPYEPETVLIPAGPFLMGSDDPAAPEGERPLREVALLPYRIGVYPVTNREYAEFLARQRNPLDFAPPLKAGWRNLKPPQERLDHPVTWVSWRDALAYCGWLSAQSGRAYRLPSEAEWEKAASWGRAAPPGGPPRYPWGDAWDPQCANAGSSDTTPVTAHRAGASAYGVQDLLGNAQEWTCTVSAAQSGQPDLTFDYDRARDGRPGMEPDPLPAGARMVHRGGSYRSAPAELRCTTRGLSAPDSEVPWRGFRVAMKV